MVLKLRSKTPRQVMILLGTFLLCILSDGAANNLFAQDKPVDQQQDRSPSDRRPFEIQIADQEDPSAAELVVRTLADGSELTRPIMDIPLTVIDQADRKPQDQSSQLVELNYVSNYPGTFQDRLAMWCAPNIRYQPLFFEDVAIERYGYSYQDRYQPVSSAWQFATSFALLPLNMMRDNPYSCTYPLGFCRPGSYAPQTKLRWLR